jgi:two-component system nitrate/nitrite response regulator NarL
MKHRFSSTIILVGKDSLLREGLYKILQSADFRILASVSCVDELVAVKALPRQLLFLMVHTGDDFGSAIKQIELVRIRHPGGSIGVVTDRYRQDELVLAFRSGASGYFVDVITRDVFIKSLELVMMGEIVFPPAFLSFVVDSERAKLDEAGPYEHANVAISAARGPVAQLSPREQTILRFLIDGDSNKSIARRINIAEATVKVHVKAILRKIGVHNRTQAAIWWINNGPVAQQAANQPGPENKQSSDDLEEIAEINDVAAPLSPINHKPSTARPIRNGVNELKAVSLSGVASNSHDELVPRDQRYRPTKPRE